MKKPIKPRSILEPYKPERNPYLTYFPIIPQLAQKRWSCKTTEDIDKYIENLKDTLYQALETSDNIVMINNGNSVEYNAVRMSSYSKKQYHKALERYESGIRTYQSKINAYEAKLQEYEIDKRLYDIWYYENKLNKLKKEKLNGRPTQKTN